MITLLHSLHNKVESSPRIWIIKTTMWMNGTAIVIYALYPENITMYEMKFKF